VPEVSTGKGGGVNLKGIAIGALVAGFLLIIGGLLYNKKRNKDRIPRLDNPPFS
jgi:hypothetical protein